MKIRFGFLATALVPALLLAACSSEIPDDAGEDTASSAAALERVPVLETTLFVASDQKAIDATLRNTETAPVSCKSLRLRAPYAVVNDCGVSGNAATITLTNVAFAAGEVKSYRGDAALGRADLERVQTNSGQANLTYCEPASVAEADCGFSCTQGGVEHAYGEPWGDAPINGTGSKWFECTPTGEVVTRGYCALVDGEKQLAGASWSFDVPSGKVIKSCLSTLAIQTQVVCASVPQHVPSGEACVPAPCGDVPHGGEVVTQDAPNGKYLGRCSYGTVVDVTLSCNAGFEKRFQDGREQCLVIPPKACGQTPHGSTWRVIDCRGNGEYVTTYRCDDGRSVFVSERKQSNRCR